MDIEEAKEYIKMIIRKQEIPDSAKALGYVYATEAIETVLSELEKKEAIINEMVKQLAKLREKRRGRLFCKSTYKCMRNKI